MNAQKYWRRIASGSLCAMAVMAIYAAATNILRDTLIFFARTLNENANELTTQHSFLFCFTYWAIFNVLLFVTLYIAVMDFRFIRMQFAMKKKALVREAWEDEDFRKLLKSTQQDDEAQES
jgi:hypothetical protein